MRQLTAIVCDDHPDTRAAVLKLLGASGCAVVVETPSVAQLRRLVAEGTPDVVVLDLARTGLTGLESVRDLHASSPASAIVVLSPFTSLREDALRAGARTLMDPHDLRELEVLLAELAAVATPG